MMLRTVFHTLCFLGLTGLLCIAEAAPWPASKAPSEEPYFKQGWGRDLSPVEAEREASRWLRETKDTHSIAVARLMRGLARYRRGRYLSASKDLTFAQARVANRDLATFFRAESFFHLGDYEGALKAFSKFSKAFPTSVWRFRAQARHGDCLLFIGRVKQGIALLETLISENPDYPHPVAIRIALADAHRNQGQLDKAAEWLDEIIWGYPEDPQVHAVREMLTALQALGASLPQHTPKDLYLRGMGLRKRKYFGPAMQSLQAVVDDDRSPSILRWRARYQIARTLFQMERYSEAVTSFRALVGDASNARLGRWAKRWESYSLEHLGRIEQSKAALLEGRGDPKKPTTETLYKVAWLYFDAAQYVKAAEYFGKVTQRGGSWARKTRFMRAWLAYRVEDYATAADAFKRLQAASRHRADRYGYWLARTLARMGDWDAAAATYRGIIESAPISYYAYQSRARLRELSRPLAIEPPNLDHIDDVDEQDEPPEPGVACEADDERPGCRLVHSITAKTSDGTTGEAPPVSGQPGITTLRDPVAGLRELMIRWGAGFVALPQAYELAVIGETRWAARRLRLVSDELRDFRRASRRQRRGWVYRPLPYVDYREGARRAEWGRLNGKDKVGRSSSRRIRFLGRSKGTEFWALLRDTYAGLGDHHYARRHTSKADRVRGRPEGPGNQRWRRRFARAYEPIVVAQSAHYGLDPSFIWALMTVESTYNPWAISRAGARGLMQVMPHTGGLVADRMTWRNFGPALLYEPEIAIEMAAWYFHQLLEKFNGQLPLAIAGYNAGPHRVALWLRRKGHLPMDEFIEEIPYTEAREYTKKVLKYLALYRRIYLGNPGFWVGQVIDPDFRDNINF